jgi:hypothetical protein
MRYEVVIADNIRCYTVIEVMARSKKAAKATALEKFNSGDCDPCKIDWDSSHDEEVIEVKPLDEVTT